MGTFLFKCPKGAGVIYKVKPLLNEKTLLTLYYSFVYPYLHYGIIAWGNTFDSYLNSVEVAQKRAIRTIASVKRNAHCEPLFQKYKLLNVHKLYLYNCSIFMFKTYHSLLPESLMTMFIRNREVNDYFTRQSEPFHQQRWRLLIMSRSIRIQGTLIWNRIVTLFDVYCSLPVFKHKVKYLLLNDLLLDV